MPATGTVCGPHSTYFRLARPPVAHTIVGVHFRPGGVRPFLGRLGRPAAPASELHNQLVTLEDLWGHHARLVHERLMQASSARHRLQIMEHELLRRLLISGGSHRLITAAVALVERATSPRPVDEVATQLGYSTRRLQQHFKDTVGVSPKAFQRVSRFQTVLHAIDGVASINWSDVALRHGYFDQAHLVNDFRAFTSLSPTAYLRHRTAQTGHLSQASGDTPTTNVFGFEPGHIERDEDGQPRHGEVYAGELTIWLHRAMPSNHAVPPGAWKGDLVVQVADVDAHYGQVQAAGASIESHLEDQPYGQREYGVRDPEGHLWWFATRFKP